MLLEERGTSIMNTSWSQISEECQSFDRINQKANCKFEEAIYGIKIKTDELHFLLKQCANDIEQFKQRQLELLDQNPSLSQNELKKTYTKLKSELDTQIKQVDKILGDMNTKNKRHLDSVRQTFAGSRKMSKFTGHQNSSPASSEQNGLIQVVGRQLQGSLEQQRQLQHQESSDYSGPQFQEIDVQTEVIRNRQEDINHIENVMKGVKDISKTMNRQVFKQGQTIDKIQQKAKEAQKNVERANSDLGKANQLHKSASCKLLIIVGIIVAVVVVVVVVLLALGII